MKVFSLILLFQFCYFFNRANTLGDSIFSNKSNAKYDKIMLFEKRYFIHIYTEIMKSDTVINIVYGKYIQKRDTVFFTPPDSSDAPNKYFCFCKTKFDVRKDFKLYNKKNKSVPPDDFELIYKKMFGLSPPNYNQITLFRSEEAIKRKNSIEFLDKKLVYFFTK